MKKGGYTIATKGDGPLTLLLDLSALKEIVVSPKMFTKVMCDAYAPDDSIFLVLDKIGCVELRHHAEKRKRRARKAKKK